MLKKITAVFMVLLCGISLYAFNAPANGNNIFELTSPRLMSGASSVAGGGLFGVSSSSIALNPALLAGEQRWAFDLDYTAFIGTSEKDKYGQGFQIGLIIPSRFGVSTTVVSGLLLDNVQSLPLGNTYTFRTAFSKDITDELYVGAGLYGGFGSDWALACDLGFWYNIKQVKWLPFLHDLRWAFSITGMGKTYSNDVPGITGEGKADFPSFFTPRIGLAGNLFDIKNFSGGISLDFSFPAFQNFVFNGGLEFLIGGIVRVSTGFKADVREIMADQASLIPSVGISFKFNFSGKDDSFLAKQGWKTSEAEVGSAYQYYEGGVHGVSGSFTARMGQQDTVAPEIILWEE